MVDVSNQLGHSSTAITLKVYSNWLPGKKKEEVDELDLRNAPTRNYPQPEAETEKAEASQVIENATKRL